MTGVPAKQTGWVSRVGNVLGEELICPETGEKYELVEGFLQLKES